MRVSGAEDLIARDVGGYDLNDDIAIGEADNKTIFRRIILVLGLGNETLAGVVVRLSGTTALVLGLVATE